MVTFENISTLKKKAIELLRFSPTSTNTDAGRAIITLVHTTESILASLDTLLLLPNCPWNWQLLLNTRHQLALSSGSILAR